MVAKPGTAAPRLVFTIFGTIQICIHTDACRPSVAEVQVLQVSRTGIHNNKMEPGCLQLPTYADNMARPAFTRRCCRAPAVLCSHQSSAGTWVCACVHECVSVCVNVCNSDADQNAGLMLTCRGCSDVKLRVILLS